MCNDRNFLTSSIDTKMTVEKSSFPYFSILSCGMTIIFTERHKLVKKSYSCTTIVIVFLVTIIYTIVIFFYFFELQVSIFLGVFGFVWIFQPFNCYCIILAILAKQLFFKIYLLQFSSKHSGKIWPIAIHLKENFPTKFHEFFFFLGW